MTSLPLIYVVTHDYSNREASYSLNCAFLPPPRVKTWKRNSHGIVIPRGKRDNIDMEPLEAGGTHAASGRGSTLGYSHLGNRGSRLCREAVTSQPCPDLGKLRFWKGRATWKADGREYAWSSPASPLWLPPPPTPLEFACFCLDWFLQGGVQKSVFWKVSLRVLASQPLKSISLSPSPTPESP